MTKTSANLIQAALFAEQPLSGLGVMLHFIRLNSPQTYQDETERYLSQSKLLRISALNFKMLHCEYTMPHQMLNWPIYGVVRRPCSKPRCFR